MNILFEKIALFFDFLWVGGTVFMCNYPLAELKDGYFQRIRAIDEIFSKKWRIYFNIEYYNKEYPFIEVRAKRAVYVNARPKKIPVIFLLLCILRCRQVYFHSIIRLLSPWQRFVMKMPLIRKIWDVHGVVPEETAFQGDAVQAKQFEEYEALAAAKANIILVVSDAMARHLCGKYGKLLERKIHVLPIIAKYERPQKIGEENDDRPQIVYAGGIDKWQQIPLMLETIAISYDRASWHIFTQDPAAFLSMLPDELQDKDIPIRTVTRDELFSLYKDYSFGFVLRDSNVINVVSCPTKLVEYIAYGLIPILNEVHLGDFVELGLQYITKNDLIAGNIPDAERRHWMRMKNFEVYNKLYNKYIYGIGELRTLASL